MQNMDNSASLEKLYKQCPVLMQSLQLQEQFLSRLFQHLQKEGKTPQDLFARELLRCQQLPQLSRVSVLSAAELLSTQQLPNQQPTVQVPTKSSLPPIKSSAREIFDEESVSQPPDSAQQLYEQMLFQQQQQQNFVVGEKSCVVVDAKNKSEVQQPQEDNVVMEQEQLQEENTQHSFVQVQDIILSIQKNLNIDEEGIEQGRESAARQGQTQLFNILLQKFKQLKKTKEEMVKFCMRKAFKFIATKHSPRGASGDCDKDFIGAYFGDADCQNCIPSDRTAAITADESFVLPFRRNSSIKTMNAAFLKRVFSSKRFVSDYSDFLNCFDNLANSDNMKKIRLMAQSVYPLARANNIKKIQSLRRLPWTNELLLATRRLASQLLAEFRSDTVHSEETSDSPAKESEEQSTHESPFTIKLSSFTNAPKQTSLLENGKVQLFAAYTQPTQSKLVAKSFAPIRVLQGQLPMRSLEVSNRVNTPIALSAQPAATLKRKNIILIQPVDKFFATCDFVNQENTPNAFPYKRLKEN